MRFHSLYRTFQPRIGLKIGQLTPRLGLKDVHSLCFSPHELSTPERMKILIPSAFCPLLSAFCLASTTTINTDLLKWAYMCQFDDKSNSAWTASTVRWRWKPTFWQTRCIARFSGKISALMRSSFSSRPTWMSRRNNSVPNP